MAVDPACGMEVDPERTNVTVEHDGRTYYFCSVGCRETFEADPEWNLSTPHPHLITSGGLLTQRLPYGRAEGEFDLEIREPGTLSVGDRSSFTKSLDDSDVRKFAEASGDTNAIHLNDEFAKRTRFRRRIVHGTLVAGTISAALAALPGLTIYLAEELEYLGPVDVGETITATCEIVEELGDDRYRLIVGVEVDEGEAVVDGSATVLIDPLPEVDWVPDA